MDGYKHDEKIVVTPFLKDGQVKWELHIPSSGKKGGPGNYPDLVIPAKQSATKIEVEINDPANLGYKFAKDGAALWVSAGSQDPTGPSTYPAQIPPDKIKTKDHDTELEFVDLNKGAKVDLHYTLNFVGPGNQQSSTLDPIIRNGGDGPGMDMYAWAYVVGGLLVAALLVVLVRRNIVKRRQKQQQQQQQSAPVDPGQR